MMFRANILLLLCAISWASCVCGEQCNKTNIIDCFPKEDQEFFSKFIKIQTQFTKYDENVDKAVQWKELKLAMDVLDGLRQSYTGEADLAGLRHKSNQLMNDYKNTTNHMFSWSMHAKTTFKGIIRMIDGLSLDRIKTLYTNLLESGESNMNQTLHELGVIQNRLNDLERDLGNTSKIILRELNAAQEEYRLYEALAREMNTNLQASKAKGDILLEECNNRKAIAEFAAAQSVIISWIIFGIEAVVTAISAIFVPAGVGAAGVSIGLSLIGSSTQMPMRNKVSEPVSCANEVGDLRAIENKISILNNEWKDRREHNHTLTLFYNELTAALENAIKKVRDVQVENGEEITYVSGMLGTTKGITGIAEIFFETYNNSTNKSLLRTHLGDLTERFITLLDNYCKRHSGGTVTDIFTQNEAKRQRRGITTKDLPELRIKKLREVVEVYISNTEEERSARFWDLDADKLANLPIIFTEMASSISKIA